VPIIIDPLSVATQGYLETPDTPNVEAARDALRLATLGWIILDFSVLPDPDQITDANIVNPCTAALVDDPSTTFVARAYSNTALVESSETASLLTALGTTANIEDAATSADLQASKMEASLEDGTAAATIKTGKADANIELPSTDADVQSGNTDGNVEHLEDD
jgi:hypothetical protein